MNPIVEAACDLAVTSAFGSGASYQPIGPSADTAFSGSAVLELEVTTSGNVTEKVVLKHSSVRKLHPSFATDDDKSKNAKKYTAAIKTDNSSRNECSFLEAYWERLLNENCNKTRIPKVLFARDHPTEGVTLLLESLSSFGENGGSVRIDEIPLGPRMEATLEWIANFHASFFPKSLNPNAFDLLPRLSGNDTKTKKANATEISPFLWSVGTHLSLEKRAPIELLDLATDLNAFADRFQVEHEYFRTNEDARKQGKRIQAVAKDVAATLHPENNPSRITMIHGDYKQGNMFFDDICSKTSSGESPSKTSNGDKIAVFDWQWTGPGIAATDLIYLCVMAVSDEALEDYEAKILKPYHTYLLRALNRGQNNAETIQNDYPYKTLVDEFKLAAIDIQRWLAGSRFKSMTPETVLKAQKNVDVNHGIFRRSVERLVWIFQTVDDALDDVESGKITLISSR
mmetsp:Transcript_19408/g.48343  ORF Transcript_19408/g.48343 Transcript_19408/m.48343 type:complete len:456 (+) Transcript_19408:623-1990(+)